jgi:hypothetical protein
MLVDAHVGILVDAHVGIWWIHFMDDIFWHIVDVHGLCTWVLCMVGTFWYMMYLVDILFMILYFIDDISFVS